MQRTHSLNSISTASSTQTFSPARYKNADLLTESLIPESPVFQRKHRKHDLSTRPSSFNFPNGEVFTPRQGPFRRNRPAKIPADAQPRALLNTGPMAYKPTLPRSVSMVSVKSTPVYEIPENNAPTYHHLNASSAHSVASFLGQLRAARSYLTRSHSFNSIKHKSKQDLVHSLRNTKIDTPTNINVAPEQTLGQPLGQNLAPPLTGIMPLSLVAPHLRLRSLTNNKYSENAPNIVRLQVSSYLPTTGSLHEHATVQSDRQTRLDSAPSSISNYNLHRSNSNTPQTSFSGSDTAIGLKLWSSCESVLSYRTAGDPPSLSSIKETAGAQGANTTDSIPRQTGIESSSIPSSPDSLQNAQDQDQEEENGETKKRIALVTKSLDNLELHDESHDTSIFQSLSEPREDTLQSQQTSASQPHNLDPATGLAFADSASTLSIHMNSMGSSRGGSTVQVDDASGVREKEKGNDNNSKDTGESSGINIGDGLLHANDHTSLHQSNCSSIYDSILLQTESLHQVELSEDLHYPGGSHPHPDTEDEEMIEGEILRESTRDDIELSEGINEDTLDVPNLETPENVALRNISNTPLMTRRNLDISPIATSSISSMPFNPSPDILSPVTGEDFRPSKLETDLLGMTDSVKVGMKSPELSPTFHDASSMKLDPVSLNADQADKTTLPAIQSPVLPQDDLYSPTHIDRFLADDQEAVPPRGDVAVKDGTIEFHPVASLSPIQASSKVMGPPPRLDSLPEGSLMPKVQSSLGKKPSVMRDSMLAVVDVDYDKLLPSSSKRDMFSADSLLDSDLSKEAELKRSPKKQKLSPQKAASSASSNPKGLKKIFKLMSLGGSKKDKETTPRLRWKSLSSSLRSSKSLPLLQDISMASGSSERPDPSDTSSSNTKPVSAKKRDFLSNLKISSGHKTHEMPHSAYSVRQKPQSPQTADFSAETEVARFDLPEFEAEGDSFSDVLQKFQEVEIEAEKEVLGAKPPKSLHDFFLKDDELSRAQIFDQQNKDSELSTDSLPFNLSSQNASSSNIDIIDATHEADYTNQGGSRRTEELQIEFPQSSEKLSLTLDTADTLASLSEPSIRRSFVRYIRQFSDFERMNVELSGFDPQAKCDITKSPTQKASILSKGRGDKAHRVRFADSIAISETYAPEWYRRYNKSVTQYYVTEHSDITRIKNELNAYKCYEMLVHEKSQDNTQFFY